jgi:hypothetical protein
LLVGHQAPSAQGSDSVHSVNGGVDELTRARLYARDRVASGLAEPLNPQVELAPSDASRTPRVAPLKTRDLPLWDSLGGLVCEAHKCPHSLLIDIAARGDLLVDGEGELRVNVTNLRRDPLRGRGRSSRRTWPRFA